jgi:hypothetical protein
MTCLATWMVPAAVLLSGGSALAAEAAKAVDEPSGDEVALLERLDLHRANRALGDQWVDDAQRMHQLKIEVDWTRYRGTAANPPLVFDHSLVAAAHALLKQGAKPVDGKRYDASAALKAASFPTDSGALVMFASDAPSIPIAYAWALTNAIGTEPEGQKQRVVLASEEAFKPAYRVAGVAMSSANGKVSLVIILSPGSAKRYVGGVVHDDADHDGRYEPGEGKGGVTVTCGAAKTVTWPSGAWSLALDSADAADVVFTAEGATGTRPIAAAADTVRIEWRLPISADARKADQLLAELTGYTGKDTDRRRELLANLLAGTRIGILDDGRAKKIADLVDPIHDDFDATLKSVREGLTDELPDYKRRLVELRKPWKGAMRAWFSEAETLSQVRAEVNATLAAPPEQRGKSGDAVLKLLAKRMAATVEPDFMKLYQDWRDQVELALEQAKVH